jgi:hypothetical protein
MANEANPKVAIRPTNTDKAEHEDRHRHADDGQHRQPENKVQYPVGDLDLFLRAHGDPPCVSFRPQRLPL